METLTLGIMLTAVAGLVSAIVYLSKNDKVLRDASEKVCLDRVKKLESKVEDLHQEYKEASARELNKSEVREIETRAEKQRVVEVLQSNSRAIAEVCGVMNRTALVVEHVSRLVGHKDTPSGTLRLQKYQQEILNGDS